jgi:hypothetical protein
MTEKTVVELAIVTEKAVVRLDRAKRPRYVHRSPCMGDRSS